MEKTKSQIKKHLETEQKVIHLMLKDKSATQYFKNAGIAPEWFDPIHRRLVECVFSHYESDCLLTADGYRQLLASEGHKEDLPLLMDAFAKCDIRAYADKNDMPVLLDGLKNSYAARLALMLVQDDNKVMNAVLKADNANAFDGLSRYVRDFGPIFRQAEDALQRMGQGNGFKPIRVCDIPDDPEPQWIWEDFIAKGEITLFAGLPKGGKTTLLANVIDTMGNGGSLITPIKAARVLVVSEERARVWKKRGPHWKHVDVVCKPQMDWSVLVDNICRYISDNGVEVVVIDTLSEHAQLEDENDSAKVLKSLRYGDRILETGAALVYLHHNRKSGGENGLGARGSNAIVGKVDIVVTVNRVGLDTEDNRRKLDLLSRLSPSKTAIVSYDGCVYTHVSKTESQMEEDVPYMMAIPANPPGATIQEIIDNWSEGEAPARKTLQGKLSERHHKKRIGRSGEGVCGNPYRYYRIVP